MLGEIQHMIAQALSVFDVSGTIDRLILFQSRIPEMFLRTHPIELQPDVFPRVVFICRIEVDLSGTDQKALICSQPVLMNVPVDSVRIQRSLAADDVMEQVVVPDKWAKGVKGGTFFPAVLVGLQVKEIFIGKNGVNVSPHNRHLLSKTFFLHIHR